MKQIISPRLMVLFVAALIAPAAQAQQSSTTPATPLTIQTSSLPKGFLRQPYTFQLQAQGGATPFTWELTSGFLPQGLELGQDGVLHGSPTTKGNFSFTVGVRDSGQPAQVRKRELSLQIVAPLVVEWSRYPRVTGQKVDCAIRVANQTAQDLDFTVVALAVAEDGRATAVGYQRFTLKGDTTNLEIPFSENLARGSYELNVDAVGEAPEINTIYRIRLVTSDRLQVQQGP